MANERVFELGMALAGGSTRGAYSAGVMDFLLQALHEWERARGATQSDASSSTSSSSTPLPPWSVRLKTLAGTSAGGITAAVTTASFGTPVTPLPNSYKLKDPPPPGNNLFKVWVQGVTLERLFATTDLDPAAGRANPAKAVPVRSLLSSDYMPKQADEALMTESTNEPVPDFAKDLELYITTSNLRGVPYSVENFQGASKELSDFRMTRHRDWVGFRTGHSARKGLYALDLNGSRDSETWDKVRAVAQGTATLPLIFPIKQISSPRQLYDAKLQWGTPSWPETMPDEYVYDAVDGGVFRNEPMELVRDAMQHHSADVLSHKVEEARGSMILLHPSPKRSTYKTEYTPVQTNMLYILWSVLGALMDEANFQDEELSEMTAVDDLSRFLVAPVRAGRKPSQEVLATDTLHGFGGIIDEEVRLHDFQLGRRNCQKFLLSHFVIPFEKAKINHIFGPESEAFVQMQDGVKVVPIIPLFGTALEECPTPAWPSFGPERYERVKKRLHDVIEGRVTTVIKSFAVSLGFYKNGFRFGGTAAWNFVVDRLVRLTANRILQLADAASKTALDQFKSA